MTMPGKIIVVSAHMEFPLCPTVYVGTTDDGATVYVRYRFGLLSVRMDSRNPAPNGGAGGRRIFEEKLDPKELDGWLEYDDLRKITADWIEWPDELTPRKFDEDDVMEL
jgi:hypothetical protein